MLLRFRRFVVIGAGLALLVGLTTGPLAASSTGKIYSVTVSPTSLPFPTGSGSYPFTVKFTNQTPGNSQISSLALTAPANYTITTAVQPIASSGNLGNYNINVITSGTQPVIQVTNLYPVGYGQSLSLNFGATVDTSNLTCSTEVGAWGTQAWTGSNFSGQQFALTGNPPTTTIGTGTALSPGSSTPTVNGVTVKNNVTSPCAVPLTVNVTQSGSSETVQALKPTIQGVGLTVDIQWAPEAATYPLPPTMVTDIVNPTPTAIQWCGGTQSAPSMPAGQVSCLISESSSIAGSGTVQIHDVIFLLGDWGAQR